MAIFSRRGFLQTLAAAAVGAATFDPKSLLWVPAAPKPMVAVDLIDTTAARVIEEQLELNDLALRFAKMMTDRLERHPSVALREVMFRQAGTVNLPPGSLEVPELGVGYFQADRTRVMPTGEMRHYRKDSEFLDHMANEMMGKLDRIDMFAPIGADLRPGEPFTDALVGLGTDPESGISVRVLRFEHDALRHAKTLTGVEMAGGHWQQARPRQRKVEV